MRVQPDHKAKVVFIGSAGVGKTSIILRHDKRDFTYDVNSTIGANFIHSTLVTHPTSKKVEMEIWDTAGNERFACMMPMYLRRTNGVFIVYDVTNRDSFRDLTRWIGDLDRTCNMSQLIVIIIGNKIDLVNKRMVDEEEARAFAENKGMLYGETSALNDQGIGEIMHKMANELVSRFQSLHLTSTTKSIDTVTVNTIDPDKHKCC